MLCYAFGLDGSKNKIIMSRIIKFRVWDGKKIHVLEALKGSCNHILQVGTDGFWLNSYETGELITSTENGGLLMQFIGFTDRTDKEIFEGDIIQYDYLGDDGQTESSFMQIFWNEKTASFCYDDSYKSDKTSGQELNEEFCNDVVVIGNIYEDAKLLAVSEADA